MGGQGTTGPSTDDSPGVWSDSPLPFFVSFIVTVFVPDSAVADQICPSRNVYRPPPMVISKKYFDITAHSEDKWPSQQNILIFLFFLFRYFFSFICRHNSTEPSPESLQCHLESV